MAEWQSISEKPGCPMGVLYYVPGEAHPDTTPGQDYTVQVGWWDGRAWLEQGTSHDLVERIDDGPGAWSAYPTHWMPLPAPPETKE